MTKLPKENYQKRPQVLPANSDSHLQLSLSFLSQQRSPSLARTILGKIEYNIQDLLNKVKQKSKTINHAAFSIETDKNSLKWGLFFGYHSINPVIRFTRIRLYLAIFCSNILYYFPLILFLNVVELQLFDILITII